MNQVSRQQIEEWAENPVTIELLANVREEVEEIVGTAITDCLVPGEPVKSHENLVELEARCRSFVILSDLLEGDWSFFEGFEEEEVEQY